ncbi:hypothetical protein GCM10009854_16390 [Saccharopolyspora halophila]|uniref:Uncharacterized protein n=1 Tax=Saccharopolyspora halophila TaxID=405551 RepID=A0ABP5T157_9PSEU
MRHKPIRRHCDFGCTFRWIRGESHIVVKRGYVCEGKSVVVAKTARTFAVADRPGEDPHDDRRTWVATIPVNPAHWSDGRRFVGAVNAWVEQNRNLVDLEDRAGRR